MITHANCVAPIASIDKLGGTGSFASIDSTDIYISYLPLAHVFERAAQGVHIFQGAAIGYYQVNIYSFFLCIMIIV